MRTLLATPIPFLLWAAGAHAAEAPKPASALYPKSMTARAQANMKKYPWAAEIGKRVIDGARPWQRFSDEELWQLVFGAAITRSHMVWSAGFCPACRKPVPMYDWIIDAFGRPWKAKCPRCNEVFPKNDFHKFYRSGLDQHGVFDPARADRSLLFNEEHPGAGDPLRGFGVDDGEGYVEGAHRWRFIGAYLMYGQWYQLVLDGIARNAAAHVVTGEREYARKAGVLLDRLADVFPTFDYANQGLVYERARYGGGRAGYVTYAINSAYDVRRLALAYDQVFEAIRNDAGLVDFLKRQAALHKLENPKTSFADVQRNIEERILRDVLSHPEKIATNYPGSEVALATIRTVLGWPASRDEVMAAMDAIVANSVPVDGLTGEKGLTGYATIAPRFLANFLESYARANPKLLDQVLQRHPKLRDTYRFFLDTWIGRQYYPYTGDCGGFGIRTPQYAGLALSRDAGGGSHDVDPPVSNFTFLWRLARATGDPVYLQLLHHANGNSSAGLPYDLFAENPEEIVRDVETAVARHGALPRAGSVDKREWRLAILRAPRNPDAGAVWLDYDSIPNARIRSHYHFDCMNLGLVAKGLDLLPEFGYPAVQFGDWHTPQARWHNKAAAHNTVVVDGQDQFGGDGKTTLWFDGEIFRAVRASSPGEIRGRQFERTVAMVNANTEDFYVLDIFRVEGGRDHAKFTHGYFGALETKGLSLAPDADYGHATLMRNFKRDARPAPGWSADWKIEDRLGYLKPGADVHLRYTELTEDAQAYTAESWTVPSATSSEQLWIPTLVVRRQAPAAPLASTFVAVLEPYEGKPFIQSARRLPARDGAVRVEVRLADGRRDIIADTGPIEFTRTSRAGRVETRATAKPRPVP